MQDHSLEYRVGELENKVADIIDQNKKLHRQAKALKRKANASASDPTGGGVKKTKNINAYMYWCNHFQGGQRNIVADDLSREAKAADPSLTDAECKANMRKIASRLGQKWRDLPEDVRAMVKKLATQHNTTVSLSAEGGQ